MEQSERQTINPSPLRLDDISEYFHGIAVELQAANQEKAVIEQERSTAVSKAKREAEKPFEAPLQEASERIRRLGELMTVEVARELLRERIAQTDPVYRAAFEIYANVRDYPIDSIARYLLPSGLEKRTDPTVIDFDMVAAGLSMLNAEILQAAEPLPVIAFRLTRTELVDSDQRRTSNAWSIETIAGQAAPGRELIILTKETPVPGSLSAISKPVGIQLSLDNAVSVVSRVMGWDDDSWFDEPRVKEEESYTHSLLPNGFNDKEGIYAVNYVAGQNTHLAEYARNFIVWGHEAIARELNRLREMNTDARPIRILEDRFSLE